MAILRNATDAWVNQALPKKNYGPVPLLRCMEGAQDRRSFIHFNKVWAVGSTVTNGRLKLRQAGPATGTITVTIHRVASSWGANKIHWDNQPGVIAGVTSLTKTNPADGTEWDFNVAALLQSSLGDGKWYGFRIICNTSSVNFHSAQATNLDNRPVLDVTWSYPPEQPTGLAPDGGRQVSTDKPTLRGNFIDRDGVNTMASIHVQVNTTNDFTAPAFDSGEVPAAAPELNLATTAFPALADGAQRYWRMRVKDSAGIWSPWSDPAYFGRTTFGTVAITSLDFTDGSPTVTWTLTGRTQSAYVVAVYQGTKQVYRSKKTPSSVGSHTIPFGQIPASGTFTTYVDVFDTINREATPGEEMYVTDTESMQFIYNAGDTPLVTNVHVTSDPLYPHAILTWSRTTQPTQWQIQRSTDAGATWEWVAEGLGSDFHVSGNDYTYKDVGAQAYLPTIWRVIPVTSGVMGVPVASASSEVRRLAPWLYRPDGTDPVVFLNPVRSQTFLDVQSVFETLGDGDPVVITQKRGRKSGTVSGELDRQAISGVTAQELLRRFLSMRDTPGAKLKLALVDQTLDVVAYNFQYEPIPTATGIYYAVSFSWVEVKP